MLVLVTNWWFATKTSYPAWSSNAAALCPALNPRPKWHPWCHLLGTLPRNWAGITCETVKQKRPASFIASGFLMELPTSEGLVAFCGGSWEEYTTHLYLPSRSTGRQSCTDQRWSNNRKAGFQSPYPNRVQTSPHFRWFQVASSYSKAPIWHILKPPWNCGEPKRSATKLRRNWAVWGAGRPISRGKGCENPPDLGSYR